MINECLQFIRSLCQNFKKIQTKKIIFVIMHYLRKKPGSTERIIQFCKTIILSFVLSKNSRKLTFSSVYSKCFQSGPERAPLAAVCERYCLGSLVAQEEGLRGSLILPIQARRNVFENTGAFVITFKLQGQ